MRPPALTLDQVCERLNAGETVVRALLKTGRLRGYKVGGWKVDPDDLERFIELEKQAAHRPTVEAAVASAFDADDQFRHIDNPFT